MKQLKIQEKTIKYKNVISNHLKIKKQVVEIFKSGVKESMPSDMFNILILPNILSCGVYLTNDYSEYTAWKQVIPENLGKILSKIISIVNQD